MYTEKYINEYSVYKGKLLDLYFKRIVANSLVKIFHHLQIFKSFVSEQNKYLNSLASGVIGEYKSQYEGMGVIPNIHSELVEFLPLPYSDWVKGSGL